MKLKFSIKIYCSSISFFNHHHLTILLQMSAFDTIEELKEALDEANETISNAQPTLEDLTEEVMKQMDEFVPEDPDLFIDTSEYSATETKEQQKMWEQKWFTETKEYLETEYGLKLVPLDEWTSKHSDSSSAYWNASLSSATNETKEENTSLIEEKKEEDAVSVITSATEETICQICMDTIYESRDGIAFDCCGKRFHHSCKHQFQLMHSQDSHYNCPNCRAEIVVIFFNKNVSSFIYLLF